MDKNRTTVDFSMMSILRIIGVVVALWFLILLRDILAILFIVFVIVTAVSPLIERLMKKGVPRPIAIASIYLTLLGAVIFKFIVPTPQRAPVIAILKKIGDKMGGWLRGQVILMFVVGIIYWLTMIVL